jgi:hypothetical protein
MGSLLGGSHAAGIVTVRSTYSISDTSLLNSSSRLIYGTGAGSYMAVAPL